MDWVQFFEKTRVAANVESFAKLAPKLGISDGAISHYRTGRRTPEVWVVADCLRIQGHPNPEKAAISIMKSEARTSPERSFWKRLAATATLIAVGVVGQAQMPAQAHSGASAPSMYIMLRRGGGWLGEVAWAGKILWTWLAHKLRPRRSQGKGSFEACTAA